jgi:hypothetical protein
MSETITTAQEAQLEELENTVLELNTLLDGAASKDMLNRLYVVFQRELTRMDALIVEVKAINEEILALVRKAQ